MAVGLKIWLSNRLDSMTTKTKSKINLKAKITISPEQKLRRQIAFNYLSGNGIEVGALHSPLEIPSDAKVSYVDRMSVNDLRKQYPELADCELLEVDIIDDGENLLTIADSSVDFVIANHMIEHCQNPIGTIKQHLRVLKSDGILYMAIPDMRYTFDKDRPLTSLEHLIRDYTDGTDWSKREHFEEWSRLVDKVPENQVVASAKNLINTDYSIHFHVWTQTEFLELLFYCKKHYFNFEIELIQRNGIEFIAVLKKII